MLFLLLSSAQNRIKEQDRVHSGKVIDWDSKKQLKGAWVTAYKTNQIESTTDCPQYKDKIMAHKSDEDGNFTLSIPSGISDYYVQFCLEGYGGFRTHSQNEHNGIRFSPDPVKLCKKEQSSAEKQEGRIAQVLDEMKEGKIDKLTAAQELAYVRDLDPAPYDAALDKNEDLWIKVRDSGGPYSRSFTGRSESQSFWRRALRGIVDFFRPQ